MSKLLCAGETGSVSSRDRQTQANPLHMLFSDVYRSSVCPTVGRPHLSINQWMRPFNLIATLHPIHDQSTESQRQKTDPNLIPYSVAGKVSFQSDYLFLLYPRKLFYVWLPRRNDRFVHSIGYTDSFDTRNFLNCVPIFSSSIRCQGQTDNDPEIHF